MIAFLHYQEVAVVGLISNLGGHYIHSVSLAPSNITPMSLSCGIPSFQSIFHPERTHCMIIFRMTGFPMYIMTVSCAAGGLELFWVLGVPLERRALALSLIFCFTPLCCLVLGFHLRAGPLVLVE